MLEGIIIDLISTSFIYLTISCLLEIKKKLLYKLFLTIGCWQLTIMVVFIGDYFNFSISIIFFLICVLSTCKGSKLKRITISLMIGSVVLAFNALCDNCIAFLINDYLLFLHSIIAIFLYCIVRILKPPVLDFELSVSLWKLLLVLTLMPLGIVFSLILLRSPTTYIKPIIISDIFLLLITISSIIGLLWAMKIFYKQQKLEQEIVLTEYNKKYYEAMEQQQFEIRRLKHDLANHLQVLSALPDSEKNNYIKGMIDNPIFAKKIYYSGDSTINAVLTAKENLINQNNISFKINIDISEELPFEKADICTLFANALDNAVEGCIKTNEDVRKIELIARVDKGMLAVRIVNSCVQIVEDQGKKLPKTTKKDIKNHGFGLKSIQYTINKYNGNMEITCDDNIFTLFMYIPLSSR